LMLNYLRCVGIAVNRGVWAVAVVLLPTSHSPNASD
jgi:hypothetical protein